MNCTANNNTKTVKSYEYDCEGIVEASALSDFLSENDIENEIEEDEETSVFAYGATDSGNALATQFLENYRKKG